MSKNTRDHWDILIIGAGASGLMAGIISARLGKKVLILEQMDKIGKKILATGNGKCNYTNAYMNNKCFRGDIEIINRVLDEFTTEECLAFFHSIGIYPKERNGYYYPNSEQAQSLVLAMTEELNRLSVKILLETKVNQIISQKDGFCLISDKNRFYGKKVLISTGLLASPKLGSNGSLFGAIKELGHHFSPIVPALCGFYCKGMPFKKVSGVRSIGRVTAIIDNKEVASDTGEVQFTDYGLSGIPVFQISRYLSLGLYSKKKVEISLDLLPDFTTVNILDELKFRQSKNSRLELFLNGLINKKLSDAIWEMLHMNPSTFTQNLSENELLRISNTLKSISVTVTNYRDFEFAQICTGGIPAKEVNTDTFESSIVKNLFFTGEILNVDGICGGYNLHFAWGSGKVAAEAACKS